VRCGDAAVRDERRGRQGTRGKLRARPERQFYFRLAAHLGARSVRHLLADIGSRELAEWRAYELITGPLGGARGDINAATIASAIVAVNTGKGKKPPPLNDFIPRWDRTRVKKTPEELFKAAMAANAALGGHVTVNN
jgi:hypothetical protein